MKQFPIIVLALALILIAWQSAEERRHDRMLQQRFFDERNKRLSDMADAINKANAESWKSFCDTLRQYKLNPEQYAECWGPKP